ncbi:RND transporter [Deltaproteobacteria bacterium]|nr:RND transporter [Deltaproteobacteria bacterium]
MNRNKLVLLGMGFLALGACRREERPEDRRAPEASAVTAGAPGAPAASAADDPADYWTCPMHPSVHAAVFGRCPLCGMDLVKVSGAANGAVNVDVEHRAHFGIRTVAAVNKPLLRTLRFAGTVGWDVRRQRDVAVRATGTVAALRVTVGSAVRAGDALFSLDSPELSAAQADLLAAAPEGRGSARSRLVALGLSEAQVDALIVRGSPLARVPVLAPVAGVVTTLNVVDGSPASPGTALARIADAGAVWIEANLSGADAAWVTDGMAAIATVDGAADEIFVGTLHPLASDAAVARVRVDVAEAGGRLRPGAVAVVEAAVTIPPSVVVPADAVVYAGTRKVVFVENEGGQLVPREVQVGTRVGDEIVVTSGLAEGDVVVAEGAFMVAADSRLRSPAAWGTP